MMGRYKKRNGLLSQAGHLLLTKTLTMKKFTFFNSKYTIYFFYNLMEILLFFLKVAFLTFTIVACR